MAPQIDVTTVPPVPSSTNNGHWRKVSAEVAPPEGVSARDAAARIISAFARRAYRRPLNEPDLQQLMSLFDAADAHGEGYVDSIRLAMKAVLVSPHFRFRIERNVDGKQPGEAFPVSDFELASRLSFFLWSSTPDEQLLDLAERGKLTTPRPSDEPVPFSGTVIGAAVSESFQGNNGSRSITKATPESRCPPEGLR